MAAATNRRNRRANARSRRRAGASWSARADRLTTMQVGGTTETMSWFSRGAMRNQYETGAIKATYSYTDINNNLRVAHDAAGLTTSTYDGDNLRRKVVSGSVTTTFAWDGTDYLQIKPSSGDATLLIVLEGEVVGHVKGSEKRDYIVDPLGSVVAYLNSSQTLTDQLEYWPYGEMVAEIEAGTEPFLWVGSLGYFRDSDLRTYIRAREYRQDLGSWMQLDPLWPNELGFAYAGSSPVQSIDPSGLTSASSILSMWLTLPTVKCSLRVCSQYGNKEVPWLVTHQYVCAVTPRGRVCSGGLYPSGILEGNVGDASNPCHSNEDAGYPVICKDVSTDCDFALASCHCISALRNNPPRWIAPISTCWNFKTEVKNCMMRLFMNGNRFDKADEVDRLIW